MIATFSMYDWPEQSGHWDAFWAALRDHLRDRGIKAPEALSRGGDLDAYWLSPDLVIGQTCGLPYRARLRDRVTLIGALDHGLPGCSPGYYHSVIVARRESAALENLLQAQFAFNAADSQSGWAAICDLATERGVAIQNARATGSHHQSARLVAEGQADVAAIDGETWRLIERHDPETARSLTILHRTAPRPGLPLITRRGVDPARYAAAVEAAIADSPQSTLDALDIRGFVRLPEDAYLTLPVPPPPPRAQ